MIQAQINSQKRIEFLICKSRILNQLNGKINPRQEKAILRIFKEGVEGFKGGLSAKNYITITGTSTATATRDLQDLAEKGVLTKMGQLKHTRYFLNLKLPT